MQHGEPLATSTPLYKGNEEGNPTTNPTLTRTEINIERLNSDDDFVQPQSKKNTAKPSFSSVKIIYFNHLRRLGVQDDDLESEM